MVTIEIFPHTVPAASSLSNDVFIILGMHRSGTSMLASMCQRLGLYIGSRLMGANPSNLKGHFEDLDFYEFHESVLQLNGLSPAGFDISDAALEIPSHFRARAQSLIDRRQQLNIPWGWKDPRTILFIRFWLDLIPQVKLLCIFRDPAQVASSLLRREDKPFQDSGETAFRLWSFYNRKLLSIIHEYDSDRIFLIDANGMARFPEESMTRLANFIDSPVDGYSHPCTPELLRQDRHLPTADIYKGLVSNSYFLFNQLISKSQVREDYQYELTLNKIKTESSVAVLIPIWHLPLQPHEAISFTQCQLFLGSFQRTIVAPCSLDLGAFDLPVERFDDHWFTSIESYSGLLLQASFYRRFSQYTYVLIYQLDSLVFSSDLEAWCSRRWHYVGAPWFKDFSSNPNDGLWATGNGGLSLRHVKACIDVLEMEDVGHFLAEKYIAEDLFWSFHAPKYCPSFLVPSPREASRFAVESNPRYFFALNNNQLPFGCHYWQRIDPSFWLAFVSFHKLSASDLSTSIYNSHNPDSLWASRWLKLLFTHLFKDLQPLSISRILTGSLSFGEIQSKPTKQGIDAVFRLILGRMPGQDWYDYWLDRPDAKLFDVISDLTKGSEFELMVKRLKIYLDEAL